MKYKSPYNEGRMEFYNTRGLRKNNPYIEGTEECEKWLEGWDDAEDEVLYYYEIDDYIGFGFGADLL